MNSTNSIKKRVSVSVKLTLVIMCVVVVVGLVVSFSNYKSIETMFITRAKYNCYKAVDAVGIELARMLFEDDFKIENYAEKELDEKYDKIQLSLVASALTFGVDRLSVYLPQANSKGELFYVIDFEIGEMENATSEDRHANFEPAWKPADFSGERVGYSEANGNKTVGDKIKSRFGPILDVEYVFSESSLLSDFSILYSDMKSGDVKAVARAIIRRDSASMTGMIDNLTFDTTFYLWLFLSLLVVPVLYFSLKFISKPVKKLTKYVGEYKTGNGSSAFTDNIKTNDEIQTLSESFGMMVENVEGHIRTVEALRDTYYKFVPVQFVQYLGKENISDIELGDAKTLDFAVMFCDIRGFSEKSEKMSALENFEFVNEVFGRAGPIIRKHGGFIDKYIGDAIMALFVSSQSAVEAGIEMYQSIVLSEKDCIRYEGEPINLGIGIHSGTAMLGIVGENMRLSSTVISNTVNLASRLESITKYYKTGMVVSASVFNGLSEPLRNNSRYLGNVKVAGISAPAKLFEILDCANEEQRKIKLESRVAFEQAIQNLHAGNLEEAEDGLDRVLKQNGKDQAAIMYKKYLREKLSEDSVTEFIEFSEK